MADVQLERGYLSIANRLDEAITYARFTLTQVKLVRCVVRLTYGWRRRTVSISLTDLAERCNLEYSGGFRRDLAALLAEGVLEQVLPPHGRAPGTYRLNKNFEAWGKYSVASALLERLFGERPVSMDRIDRSEGTTERTADKVPPSGQATTDGADDEPTDEPMPEDAGSLPHTGQYIEAERAGSVPPLRQGLEESVILLPASTETVSCLQRGSQTPAKSLFGEILQSPKDRKTVVSTAGTVKTTTTNSAAAAADDAATATAPNATASADQKSARIREYAIGLAVAANVAIEARWGEQLRPINYAGGLDMAQEFLGLGVPLELARATIVSLCRASKLTRPMSALSYFRQAIVEAFHDAEQRALNVADPSIVPITSAMSRGGTPRLASDVIRANDVQREREDYAAFEEARKLAAIAWGKAPANRAVYARIVETVTGEYDGFDMTSSLVQKGIASSILLACAERAGFPTFEVWRVERTAAIASES